MSAHFLGGNVFSLAGPIRLSKEEVAAMEDETELFLLDYELDLLLKDDFMTIGGDLMEMPEPQSAESADDVLAWFRRVKAGEMVGPYEGGNEGG